MAANIKYHFCDRICHAGGGYPVELFIRMIDTLVYVLYCSVIINEAGFPDFRGHQDLQDLLLFLTAIILSFSAPLVRYIFDPDISGQIRTDPSINMNISDLSSHNTHNSI